MADKVFWVFICLLLAFSCFGLFIIYGLCGMLESDPIKAVDYYKTGVVSFECVIVFSVLAKIFSHGE